MKITLYDYENNKIAILKNNTSEYIDGETYNERVKFDINGQSELTMILPLYTYYNGFQEENHRWAYIIAEYLVKLEEEGEDPKWFKIKSTDNVDNSGKLESNIQCKSIAYDLNKRNTEFIPDNTDTAENLMALALQNTGWTVGTVTGFGTTQLTLNSTTASNATSLLNEIANLFDGYLTYNTDSKTVDLTSNSVLEDTQILFTPDKNMKSLERRSTSEDIVTRLYGNGAEIDTGIVGIQEANPTGEPYVDNFDYYINNGMITPAKQALITQYNIDITNVNNNLTTAQSDINTTENSISIKTVQLNTSIYSRDSKQNRVNEIDEILEIETNAIIIAQLTAERAVLVGEISTLNTAIGILQTELATLEATLVSQQAIYDGFVNDKNVIKDDFYTELGDFIHEGVYTNSNLITPQSLYDDTVSILEEWAVPKVFYSLDLVDLSKSEGYELEKIKLGALIDVYDSFLKLKVKVRVTSITQSLENPLEETSVSVANYYSNIEEVFQDIVKNNEIIKQQQAYWDRSERVTNSNGTLTQDSLQDTFDLNVYTTKNGTNESVVQDKNGITFTDLADSNQKVRINGGRIETSNDGGTTWTVVVNSDGSNVANVFGGVMDITEVYLKGDTYFFWNGDGFFAFDSTSSDRFIKFNKDGLFFTLDNEASYELSMTWAGLTIGSHTIDDIDDAIDAGINFNNRNDRISVVPANPVVLSDGTAIDHTQAQDASVDISFEWQYTGTGDAYNIDGFFVYVRSSWTSGSYVFGTNPEEENMQIVDFNRRAAILRGVPSNKYYTFGVQAYRNVDQDIAADGVLRSAIVQSTRPSEDPYQPNNEVPFGGNVIGTIQGESSGAVVTLSLNSLQESAFYNRTRITTADGIQIFDLSSNERLKMGQLDATTFGFYTRDASGTIKSEIRDDGTLRAVDGVFSGSITIGSGSGIANLSDAGDLAVKDSVDFNVAGEILNAGDLAVLDSVNGTYIDDNSITTPKIFTGAVTASKISVGSLSAISANIGSITAGTITGVEITAIDPTYDSKAVLDAGNLTFARKTTGVEFGSIGADAGLNLRLEGSNGIVMDASIDDDITMTAAFINLNGLAGVRISGDDVATEDWVISQGYGTGTITGVSAGSGLSGGGSSGSVSLSVDDSVTRCSASGVSSNGLNIVYSSFGITIQRVGSSDSITLAWD